MCVRARVRVIIRRGRCYVPKLCYVPKHIRYVFVSKLYCRVRMWCNMFVTSQQSNGHVCNGANWCARGMSTLICKLYCSRLVEHVCDVTMWLTGTLVTDGRICDVTVGQCAGG